MRQAAAALLLAASLASSPGASQSVLLSFDELSGWAEDDHAAAFAVFDDICPDLRQPDWAAVCAFATTRPDPRRFFEIFFRPVRIGGAVEGLFTGYYEPEMRASPVRTAWFRIPVYALPPEAQPGTAWLTRAEIEDTDELTGRGLEIAWLHDPVDLHHLQIQGSGRLRMTDGRLLRLGYAGRNGHARVSIAGELIRRGELAAHEASTEAVRTWVRRNRVEGRELLRSDPSYVFFRVLENHPPERGPLGAMNRALTPERSLAVDPAFVPLGAPVWIETDGAPPRRRLMVAQDTGGAIKGPQRGDIFFGTGPEAGRAASVVRDPGRLIVLLPVERALALADGG